MSHPWDNEPPEWRIELMGMKRNPAGVWCGYVGVPRNHPAFGLRYDDERLYDIQIHGGLTYSEDHYPDTDPDGNWWFGFDCAHGGDLIPLFIERGLEGLDVGVYRDYDYVRGQVLVLAKQLVEMIRQHLRRERN